MLIRNPVVFIVILLCMIFIAGCSSPTTAADMQIATPTLPAAYSAQNSTQTATPTLPTPTPAIVYATVPVTVEPTAASSQDPIIGVWGYIWSSGDSVQMQFNSDHTVNVNQHFAGYVDGNVYSGMWSSQGTNSYKLLFPSEAQPETWHFDPIRDAIYSVNYPNEILPAYQGNATTVTKQTTATTLPTPTPQIVYITVPVSPVSTVSTTQMGTPTQPTSTPQIVYTTTTVTATPIVSSAPTLDPIFQESFSWTCQGCTIQNDTLSCTCLTTHNSWIPASIALPCNQPSQIINCNGQLQCGGTC